MLIFYWNKLEFVTVGKLQLSLMIIGKAGAYPCGVFYMIPHYCRLPTLPESIRLEWKWLKVTNTLILYHNEIITAVIFLLQAQECFKLA